jgi:hypothetical protein
MGGGENLTQTQLLLSQSYYTTTFSFNLAPLTIVIDRGIHFINYAICYLTDHFTLRHINSW